MSICFDLPWNVASLINEIEPALSLYITVVGWVCPKRSNKFQSQTASFVAWELATYSASQVEVVTMGWHLEL